MKRNSPIFKPEKIQGVRDVYFDDHTARLVVSQGVPGSAYMKIYGWVVKLFYAGFDNTIIILNEDHPHTDKIKDIVRELRGVLPDTFQVYLHVQLEV